MNPAEQATSDVPGPEIHTAKKTGDAPSDVANAERFTGQYGDQVRYQISKKAWFIYDGSKWVEDRAGAILIRAFESVRDFSPRCHSHGKLVSLLEEAKPRLAIEPAAFDADPWLLNVLNGVLNLKTGQLRPHSKSDFITRQCPVNFDKAARCPLWMEFLGEIFQGDESLISYVQDVVGYSLTGVTSEQVFFMAYGQKAGNGKSTFFSVLRALLGTYAGHTSVETILKQKNYVMPDALAQWDKLRLMTTSEVPEGRQLNEALVKDMTGGEPIKARPLYGEWFDFNPQMKLWIPGNTRPKTSSNRGIMRRAKSIPFNFVVPEHKIDINKAEKLIAELPGILDWAFEGCRRWHLTGFEEPLTVIQSTEEFKDEMNIIRDFIDSCCEKSDGYTTREKLFPLYENWHRKNIGPRPMSGTDFGIGLRELGIDKVRITEPGTGKKLTVYQNIKMTAAAQEEYGELLLGHTSGHTPNQEGELWQ
jgi:putative DNA primase/helicase